MISPSLVVLQADVQNEQHNCKHRECVPRAPADLTVGGSGDGGVTYIESQEDIIWRIN